MATTRIAGSVPLLLGLDVGTTAIKAVLLDREGRAHGTTRAPTPFRSGELAPPDLLSAPNSWENAPPDLLSAVRRVLEALDAPGRACTVAVGIAGLAESGAAYDADGQPLGPIIAWNDPRGAEVVDRLRSRLGADLDRVIGQRLRTVSSVAKLGWLLEHAARSAGPVARWLGVPELVLHALTGVSLSEFSLAARTGAYDLVERRYLPEVVDVLGVAAGTDVFPPVVPAGSVMGRISEDGARWSGLPVGIPVTLGGHDHLVGRVGAGVGPADLANSVGTAEVVVAVLPVGRMPDVEVAIEERVAVTLLPGGQAMAILASGARAGLVVAAVAQALGCPVDELDLRSQPADCPRPSDLGERIIDAALASRPLPIDAGQPPELIWPITAAALAARTWGAVDRLARVASTASVSVGGLVVYGGGSRSRLWLEAKAQVRPEVAVWRSQVDEAVARGAALFAGVAAGWWPSVDAAPNPALERITPPPPPWRAGRS